MDLRDELENVLVTEKTIALERYNFFCRIQKNVCLEQFHAELIDLASKADCGDKEKESMRDKFTTNVKREDIGGTAGRKTNNQRSVRLRH